MARSPVDLSFVCTVSMLSALSGCGPQTAPSGGDSDGAATDGDPTDGDPTDGDSDSDSGASDGGPDTEGDSEGDSDGGTACPDVPDPCDGGTCVSICGVDLAVATPPTLEGFTPRSTPAPYGPRIPVGDLALESRGSRWLVYEGDADQASGELLYPGTIGPILAGGRAFIQDQVGNLVRLDLSDPASPGVDLRLAPAVWVPEEDGPRALARPMGSSRGELVYVVDGQIAFVDVSGDQPRQVSCLVPSSPRGDSGWHDVVAVTDAVVVTVVGPEDESGWRFEVFDRDGDGRTPVGIIEAAWESPGYRWRDTLVVHTPEDPPRLGLYRLAADGVTELARADLPEGASPFSWGGQVFSGFLTFSRTCALDGCAAFDMDPDRPLEPYLVDASVFHRFPCVAQAAPATMDPPVHIAPRLRPDERFTDPPALDCGPVEHPSWYASDLAWSPDGASLALFGYDPDRDATTARIWTPATDAHVELTLGVDEPVQTGVWWDGDWIVAHSGISCDTWQDWIHLHRADDPAGAPARVDLPGPMLDMVVHGGLVWAVGWEGSYDCANADQPDLPPALWALDLAAAKDGFRPVALPAGSRPEEVLATGGHVWLLGGDRVDVLDATGTPLGDAPFATPPGTASAASNQGLFVRGRDGRVHLFDPGSTESRTESAACSETFPLQGAGDDVLLLARDPGGMHVTTSVEIRRAQAREGGDTLELEVSGRLPWGGPTAPNIAAGAGVAIPIGPELLIVD